jgi:O-antigen biosynthesis protein WbqP
MEIRVKEHRRRQFDRGALIDKLKSMMGTPVVPEQTAWRKISKRSVDIIWAGGSLLLFCLPMLVVALMVKLTSRGPVIYWSDRIGRNNKTFSMPKFRTMRTDTPPVATHLMEHPENYLTPIGEFLRKSSLDELPQLFSVIKGDMSVVGPRPALFNQDDLVKLRTERGIHLLTPGVTGWAQMNGRDELPIPAKVSLEEFYLRHQSFLLDMKILFATFVKVMRRAGVSH